MNSHRSWGHPHPAVLLVLLTAGAACELQNCPDLYCPTSTRLTGTLQVPETASAIDARYCGDGQCVGGMVALSPGLQTCAREPLEPGGNGAVCLTWRTAGNVEVRAEIMNRHVPPDGEPYTLVLVERGSGVVLLNEAREANYETTRPDDCTTCTGASMSL